MHKVTINLENYKADPQKSLLDDKWYNLRKHSILLIILFFLLVVTVHVAIMFLVMHILAYRTYLEVKKMKEEERVEDLLQRVKYHFASKYKPNFRFLFSVYALVDLRNEGIAPIILEKMKAIELINPRYTLVDKQDLHDALEVLALKLGFDNFELMVEEAEKKGEDHYSILVSKVYFIEEDTHTIRGMISGQILDIQKEKILACPHCGGMAKQKMLTDWLSYNNYCPVCHKKLQLSECPLVVIKTKEDTIINQKS